MKSSVMLFLIQMRPHPGKGSNVCISYIEKIIIKILMVSVFVVVTVWIHVCERQRKGYFPFFARKSVFIIYVCLLNGSHHMFYLINKLIDSDKKGLPLPQSNFFFPVSRLLHRTKLKFWRLKMTGWRQRPETQLSPRGHPPSPPAALPPRPHGSPWGFPSTTWTSQSLLPQVTVHAPACIQTHLWCHERGSPGIGRTLPTPALTHSLLEC